MQRTILSVGYPLTPVGPDAVGGSEQVLALLDRKLIEAGYRSIVIAAEGSKIQGTLISSPAGAGILDHAAHEWGRKVHQQLIRETLERYPVDLVHMHSLDFHCYLPAAEIPVLATLHLPQDWFPRSIFNVSRRNFHMNCVSWSQHSSCPASPHMVEPIPNGVDVDRLASGVLAKGDYALSLGRVCPEKAFHLALDAAHVAGVPLVLAGQVFPYPLHFEYFNREIQPRLDELRRFIGPVRFSRKRSLLSRARCLVISSGVAETSSLVAMEALACGTPVVTFGCGALPEVIEHGETGFIVDNVKEMAEAIRAAGSLDGEKCRTAARHRFSGQAMAARYLSLYERLITSNSEEVTVPAALDTRCAATS
jgi:glycosyltransferase involved in cell wall biosynthesis